MPKVLSEAEIQDFRERLCKVAARLFVEKGYEKVTMRMLADELQVSRMTPYRYFADKAEILAAIRAEGFKQLFDETAAAMSASNHPVQDLEALSRVYFEFAMKNQHLYRMMFEMSQDDEQEYPELQEQLDRVKHIMIRASTIGVDAGILKKDATLASQLFWAGMHGVISLHLSSRLKLGWEFEDLAKEMIETLFRGMSSNA